MNNKFLYIFFFVYGVSYAQVLTNSNPSSGAPTSLAFIDGSSSSTYNNVNNAGKGIIYPRTDLTSITSLFDSGSLGSASYNPNYYDGLVVFNTGIGAIPSNGMGSSTADVSPGFYYYRNTGNSWNTGVWTPIGGEASSPKIHITENTPTETNLVTANTASEKVISITGIADGITTHMDLGTTVLPKDTVVNFRKAIICDSTGAQVLVATGSYDSATNKFVTGNGMMNYCLPAGNDYKVELYYTSN